VSAALTGRREGMADVIRVGESSEGSGGDMNKPAVDILGPTGDSGLLATSE